MDFKQHIHRDGLSRLDGSDAVNHGVDIAEHLGGSDIRRSFFEPTGDLDVKESPRSDPKTSDP